MKMPDFRKSYEKQTARLKMLHGKKKAMSLAVGGDFKAVGELEFALLKKLGLDCHDTVIDVGCGSGRLAYQLRTFLDGVYVGIDVVESLYKYASQLCERNDWKFYRAPGLQIPEKDGSADFVCFFSVFTHLLHEESFKYLQEAARVVKENGLIVVSFLEFRIPSHWAVFEQVLSDNRADKVLNQFLSLDALECWAGHLNLEIVEVLDGDKPEIPLQSPVIWDDGREMTEYGNLGQSICILRRSWRKAN